MFGDLGGLPVNSTAAKAGTGLGDTYTFTGSVSHVFSPTFLVDAYLGVTTIESRRSPIGSTRTSAPAFSGSPARTATIASTAGGLTSTSPTTRTSATPAAATRPTSTTTGRCTPPTRPGRKGAHAEVRRRHRPSGDESPRARRRLRQLHLRRGTDTDPGRTGRKPVQHHRGVPARAADGHLEERDSLRERLHAEPQLAVQLLRARPVAAHAPTASLGLRYDQVPMGTRTTRTRALRSRHESDADLRRRAGADRLRLRHGPRKLVPTRGGLPPHRIVVRGGYGINYDPIRWRSSATSSATTRRRFR